MTYQCGGYYRVRKEPPDPLTRRIRRAHVRMPKNRLRLHLEEILCKTRLLVEGGVVEWVDKPSVGFLGWKLEASK